MSNERRWIKVRDFLTFKPKEILENKRFLFETKDSKSESGHSLLVRVDATHAGIVTGNRKFYRPDFMQDSCHTWVPGNRPLNPVLRQHDEEGDVLGRILEAKYIDDSWKYSKDFPILRDMVFYNRDSRKKVNLFKSIDWIVDNLRPLKEYQGLGHIELGLRITNPDAIAKVLRDEYLCVSSGAITDEAICSVCHTDWASNDKCEHRPGDIVDGRPMFLISGRFKYQELSFVNFGADPFAAVKGKELKDSLEQMFFLGLPIRDQEEVVSRGLKLTDSLYESDLQIHIEDAMTIDLAALEQTVKSPELTAAQAFEVRDTLLSWQPETEEDKSAKRSLQSTLTAKIRKNGWKAEEVSDKSAEAPAAEELAAVTTNVDKEDVASAVAEAESTSQPVEDGQAKLKCFACEKDFLKADAQYTCDGEPFCKDCEEKVREQDKLKKHPAAEEIKTSISDELKALGIEFKLLDAEAKEISADAKSCLDHYDALDNLHKSADDDLKWRIAELHGALGERWGKDRWVEYAKQCVARHNQDSQLVSKTELNEKDEAILSQDTEIKTLKDTVATKDAAIAKFFTDSKRSLATSLVMANCLRAKEGFTGLTAAQIEDKIVEFAKRHISSLRDSVTDLFNELQWTKTTAAEPAAGSNDSGPTVNDNAHVSETESFKVPELKVQDAQLLKRHLAYITDPAERARFAADVRYGRVQLS